MVTLKNWIRLLYVGPVIYYAIVYLAESLIRAEFRSWADNSNVPMPPFMEILYVLFISNWSIISALLCALFVGVPLSVFISKKKNLSAKNRAKLFCFSSVLFFISLLGIRFALKKIQNELLISVFNNDLSLNRPNFDYLAMLKVNPWGIWLPFCYLLVFVIVQKYFKTAGE